MSTFYLENTGTCTRVKLYGEDVRNLLLLNEWDETNDYRQAEYIFINTCSFLQTKADYFLNKIQKHVVLAENNQKIVIIGCLGGVHKDDIESIDKEIIIFTRDLNEIKNYFNFANSPVSKATNVGKDLSNKKKLLKTFNKYILKSKHIDFRLKQDKVCYLQMSVGCLGKCSYCSEKFITKLYSRPIPEIMEAIYDGIDRGFELFSLSSDDASAYGKDIGSSLDELLLELQKIENPISIIIPEFNPQGLSDSVIESLKDDKFLYITIPIQSGSQDILNKMKRPYQIDEVLEKVRRIKENNKKLMINTHIIVGFPGETENDFEKTKELLKTGLFDRVKVFMYSERPGTEAAEFPNKISNDIKEKRRDEILKLMKIQNLKKMSLTNLILNLEQIKE